VKPDESQLNRVEKLSGFLQKPSRKTGAKSESRKRCIRFKRLLSKPRRKPNALVVPVEAFVDPTATIFGKSGLDDKILMRI